MKHIVARIKYPQTNGKIERFFGEVERRADKFGSVDAAFLGDKIRLSLTEVLIGTRLVISSCIDLFLKV